MKILDKIEKEESLAQRMSAMKEKIIDQEAEIERQGQHIVFFGTTEP